MTFPGKLFLVPFANTGDKSDIPDDVQMDGSVSFEEGYGVDYQLEQGVDPSAKDIERDKQNQLFYDITFAQKLQQTQGAPVFITTADNGGSPFPYDKAAMVRYDDGSGFDLYISLVATNTATPADATKWGRVFKSPIPTGISQDFWGSSLPAGGWLWLNGLTIGDAASGATARANADTSDLYSLLWTAISNSVLPIQASDGTPTTRGGSAAADFAAHKRLPLPDARGRTLFGKDDMGGAAAAGRLTASTAQGIVGGTLGAAGGEQAHTPVVQELPAHGHDIPTFGQIGVGMGDRVTYAGNTTQQGTATIYGAQPTGGGTQFNEIPPGIVCNKIIKL